MENISIEYMVKVKPPKIAIVFKAVIIFMVVASATTIPGTGIIGLGFTAIFAFLLYGIFKRYNIEYEYLQVDESFTIDKIINKSSRKKCGEYDITKAEVITRPESQEALRRDYKNPKKLDYTSNDADKNKDVIVIYTYNSKKQFVKIYVETNEALLAGIKKIVPREIFKI